MRQALSSIGIPCIAMLGILGCADQAPTPDVEPPATAAEIEAVLARADLVDGIEDHVVSQCSGCALAMEGKAEQAVRFGDYTLRFCSDTCRERFEENPEKALRALGALDEEQAEAAP